LTGINERQVKLEGEVGVMKERQLEAEKDIKSNRDGVSALRAEISVMKTEWKTIAEKVEVEGVRGKDLHGEKDSNKEEKKPNELQVRVQISEALEIEKRKMNVVIKGVAEDVEELSERVGKILGEIVSDLDMDVVQVKRIGFKKVGKSRLVRVKLPNITMRRNILYNARNLAKSEEFKNVYVMPDWTRNQVENDRKLRFKLRKFREEFKDTEDKDSIRIVRGKVVKGMGEHAEVLYEEE
jgi:hypothetical protein